MKSNHVDVSRTKLDNNIFVKLLNSKPPPNWSQDTIKEWYDVHERFENYIASEHTIENASIDFNSVVGTDHPSYAGSKWGEMIKHAKNITSNINYAFLDDKPNFVIDDAQYHSMDGENWYIMHQGNHRTCIAKHAHHYGLIDANLSGATKVEYVVDYEFIKNVKLIKHFIDKKGSGHYSVIKRKEKSKQVLETVLKSV